MRELGRAARGTAGRIMELLRRGPMTVDELARALDITRTAVRAQLASLLHDNLVEHRGSRRGASKPSHVYGVTANAELLFSRAYVPMFTELVHVLAQRMRPRELSAALREAGRSAIAGRSAPGGSLRTRVAAASSLLNELGGLTEVAEEDGQYIIRSHGCPLAAVTADHPEVCNALESLLTEFVGSRVSKCCDRYDRVRCCFEVSAQAGPSR
jgi:predicted ArsR family transcriptional regulator